MTPTNWDSGPQWLTITATGPHLCKQIWKKMAHLKNKKKIWGDHGAEFTMKNGMNWRPSGSQSRVHNEKWCELKLSMFSLQVQWPSIPSDRYTIPDYSATVSAATLSYKRYISVDFDICGSLSRTEITSLTEMVRTIFVWGMTVKFLPNFLIAPTTQLQRKKSHSSK